jgi:hypothetical protein
MIQAMHMGCTSSPEPTRRLNTDWLEINQERCVSDGKSKEFLKYLEGGAGAYLVRDGGSQ